LDVCVWQYVCGVWGLECAADSLPVKGS